MNFETTLSFDNKIKFFILIMRVISNTNYFIWVNETFGYDNKVEIYEENNISTKLISSKAL